MYCSKIHFRVIKINCHWINPSLKVFELVETMLGYNGSDLRGSNAKIETNDARYVAMCCIKKLNPSISTFELGKLFKRSRAASYRMMEVSKAFSKTDKKFKEKLNLVSNELFCLRCIYKKVV